MTIIVGIICENGLAMACDSQTSAGDMSYKRTDTTKIADLTFGGQHVLVAQSGDVEIAARVVEIIQKSFESDKFDDYRKPADVAEQAMRQAKQELIALNNWEDSKECAKDYLENSPVALMLAYYHAGKPYLYVIRSLPGFATQQKRYSAIGCGGSTGEFILSRCETEQMTVYEGIIASIYAVEEVKRVDPACGGPTRIGVLFPGGKSVFSESEKAEVLKCALHTLSDTESTLRRQWSNLMDELLKNWRDTFHIWKEK